MLNGHTAIAFYAGWICRKYLLPQLYDNPCVIDTLECGKLVGIHWHATPACDPRGGEHHLASDPRGGEQGEVVSKGK